jgi:hypothetical protein
MRRSEIAIAPADTLDRTALEALSTGHQLEAG